MSSIKTNRLFLNIQSFSGIVFATFVCVHLTNHVMAIFSMDLHTSYLHVARKFYRNPIIEVGILLAIVTHILCAVRNIWTRPQIAPKNWSGTAGMILGLIGKVIPWSLPTHRKIHRIIGYMLMVIMAGHIMAFRIIPQVVLGYDNMNKIDGRIVTADIKLKPQVFIPYMFLVFIGGVYHTTHGLYLTKQRLTGKKSGSIPSMAITLGAMCVAAAVTAGIGGFLYKIDIPWKDIEPILKKLHLME